MQIPTATNGTNESPERNSPTRVVSPTPTLPQCKHCGEEYCACAVVDTAQAASKPKDKPKMVKIPPRESSDSLPARSAPAKPLRKKRKMTSLVEKAKEQAESVPTSPVASVATDEEVETEDEAEVEDELEAEIEEKQEFSSSCTIIRDFATGGRPCMLAETTAELNSQREEARRALDELCRGVSLTYKGRHPSTAPKTSLFLH